MGGIPAVNAVEVESKVEERRGSRKGNGVEEETARAVRTEQQVQNWELLLLLRRKKPPVLGKQSVCRAAVTAGRQTTGKTWSALGVTRWWRSDSWLRLAGSDSSAAAVNQKESLRERVQG